MSKPCWYIENARTQTVEQLDEDEILRRWLSGSLPDNTRCWREGMPQWVQLVEAEPLATAMLRVRQDPALIHFYCTCGNQISMARKFAGSNVKCKQCGTVVRVPPAAGQVTGDSTSRPLPRPPAPTAGQSRIKKAPRVRGGVRLALWLVPLLVVAGGAIAYLSAGDRSPLRALLGRTTPAPPKQMLQDSVRACLPAFLSLDNLDWETISTGPESVKVNFKAVVTPQEDLYQVEREVDGTPRITLLKVVQRAGAKMSLYGFIQAQHVMDQWTLEPLQIQAGLKQFGSPQGTFGPQCYVAGTDAANAVLKEQAANAEAEEKARKAALAQQELERRTLQAQQERERRERQAREEEARVAFEKQKALELEQRKKEDEQRQAEEEGERQKIILATLAGTSYAGTISYEGQRQRIFLRFTEQNGFLIRAIASNPNNPKQKQTFVGDLVLGPRSQEDKPEGAYPIVMTTLSEDTGWRPEGFDIFYFKNNVSLRLRLADVGLEGAGGDFTIRLQRVGATSRTSLAAASRPATDVDVSDIEGPTAPAPRRPIAPAPRRR